MRGNEQRAVAQIDLDYPTEFPIPMRGNEHSLPTGS